jgi:hypothetical protein
LTSSTQKLGIIALVILSLNISAAELKRKTIGPPDPKNNRPRLYDLATQFPLPADRSPLLPNRVYMVYVEQENHRWYFVLTDGNGDLAEPLDLLRSGSVLSGTTLGSSLPQQTYLLRRDSFWVPSSLSEQHYYWTLSTPPIIKIVGFKTLVDENSKTKGKGS